MGSIFIGSVQSNLRAFNGPLGKIEQNRTLFQKSPVYKHTAPLWLNEPLNQRFSRITYHAFYKHIAPLELNTSRFLVFWSSRFPAPLHLCVKCFFTKNLKPIHLYLRSINGDLSPSLSKGEFSIPAMFLWNFSQKSLDRFFNLLYHKASLL